MAIILQIVLLYLVKPFNAAVCSYGSMMHKGDSNACLQSLACSLERILMKILVIFYRKSLHYKGQAGNTKKDLKIDLRMNQQVTAFQILLEVQRELCK